jgi:hypothetical protein
VVVKKGSGVEVEDIISYQGKNVRSNVSPITVGSSATALLEEIPPTAHGTEVLTLINSSLQEDNLRMQPKPSIASIPDPLPSPIQHVFTNAAGAAILRTIGNSGNAESCASSVSTAMAMTNVSLSPSYTDNGGTPVLQPQHAPQNIYSHASQYGNVVMHPLPVAFHDRLLPYSYSDAGWMFMPIGYCPPNTATQYRYGKAQYEAVNSNLYHQHPQQQQYYSQFLGSPSEYSNEGMRYAAIYGQDYWAALYTNHAEPPASGWPNSYHYLNVEAPEFNPSILRLQ